MARQSRHTEPLETLHGTLTEFSVIDRHLLEAEYRGRLRVFSWAEALPTLSTYDDHDIRELHRAMFGDLLDWAGQFRIEDHGPGGIVHVPWPQVPVSVRMFAGNLKAWIAPLPADPSLEQIANFVADAHHEFQRIHPFKDTNGRTGRVLDLFLLWATFGFKGASVESSPVIEPFPTSADEDDYYIGLQEADVNRPERLRRYYLGRIAAIFAT